MFCRGRSVKVDSSCSWGNWTHCLLVILFRLRDTSPTGHFMYWTVHLLSGHFAYLFP